MRYSRDSLHMQLDLADNAIQRLQEKLMNRFPDSWEYELENNQDYLNLCHRIYMLHLKLQVW